MSGWLYILRCKDGSYYTGTTRSDLETRVAEHNAGVHQGYTFDRRPVELIYSEFFEDVRDAMAAERKVKGWSRAKKAALINHDFAALTQLSKRRRPHGSRRAPLCGAPHHED